MTLLSRGEGERGREAILRPVGASPAEEHDKRRHLHAQHGPGHQAREQTRAQSMLPNRRMKRIKEAPQRTHNLV